MGLGTGGLGTGGLGVGIVGIGTPAGVIRGPGVVADPPPGAISDPSTGPGSDFVAQGDAAQPVNAAAGNKMSKRTSAFGLVNMVFP